jgi:ABC-type molybdate transport system ATPase subunit
VQASSSGNYIAKEALKNSFVQQSPSVITTRSVDELDLQVGSQVIVLIKSTDVSLAKL